MKVLYKNPNNNKYYRWHDLNGDHDIWYLESTIIYDYKNAVLRKN